MPLPRLDEDALTGAVRITATNTRPEWSLLIGYIFLVSGCVSARGVPEISSGFHCVVLTFHCEAGGTSAILGGPWVPLGIQRL